MSIYDFSVKKANSEEMSLKEYDGKVLLIVNTATKCGLAGQFEELENLHQKYKEQGFIVLGFPCGQFANQEPGTDEEIQSACKMNFGVTFPLFKKIEVNGGNTDPLYKYLKSKKGGWFSRGIKWNFTKFLIDKEGNVIERYAPTFSPQNIAPDIERLLKK
ncbi:glutathione peroxidase [Candidatus Gracilibacteria bacterium]|nr:glutathione peroxidase [Candidatus Gracilibacteria bacterium]